MSLPESISSLMQMPRIPIAKIRENVVTVRTEYDDESLDELGDSMIKKFQLQAIIVQPGDGDWFDLVIGSRRLRAAKRKGLQEIGGYVIDKRNPVELLFLALTENLQRVDLNPFEEAQSFLRLMKEYDLDMKAVAAGVNKPGEYIRRRLQLLSLPEDVKALVAEKHLAMHHIPVLAHLPSGEEQVRFARLAVAHHLTQGELRAEVAQELQQPTRRARESYELTALKVQAKLGEFTGFLQKVPRRMNLRRVNAAEKTTLLQSLQGLEDEVRVLRATISGVETVAASDPGVIREHVDPRNHGEDWTTADIRRINSPRRPSDEELSVELGRTPTAIRAMRAQTHDKKREKT